MKLEMIEGIIAEVRLKDDALEWKAACDEIMDRIRYQHHEERHNPEFRGDIDNASGI